jgi:hypothetical protein
MRIDVFLKVTNTIIKYDLDQFRASKNKIKDDDKGKFETLRTI